jgi:hypothetical protein
MKVIALVSGGKVVLRTHDPLPYNLMGIIVQSPKKLFEVEEIIRLHILVHHSVP